MNAREQLMKAYKDTEENPRCINRQFHLINRVANYSRFARLDFTRISIIEQLDSSLTGSTYYFHGIVVFIYMPMELNISATIIGGRIDSFSFIATVPGEERSAPLSECVVRQFITEQVLEKIFHG